MRHARDRVVRSAMGTLVAVMALAIGASAAGATDLSISHVELTQVLQTASNDIPLVLGKPLAVRVYVNASGERGPGRNGEWKVTGASLDVFHGSTRVGTLFPQNTSIFVPPTPVDFNHNRPDAARTFNFLIPAGLQFPDGISIRSMVNGDGSVPEPKTLGARLNDALTMNVGFIRTFPLSMLGILFTSPTHPFSQAVWDHFYDQASFLTKTYPVSAVIVNGRGSSEYWGNVANANDPVDPYFPGAIDLLANIDNARATSSVYRNMSWYVLQPWNTCVCGYGDISNGPLSANAAATGQDETSPYLGIVMAQELGHNFGLLHTGHVDSAADPNCCPFGTTGLAADGNINAVYPSTFGFDTSTMQPIPPGVVNRPLNTPHIHDFMSYGSPPTWVSDYTYLKLLSAMRYRLQNSLDRPAAEPTVPYFLLSGHLTSTAGTLDPALTVSLAQGSNDQPGTGTAALDLLDGSGKTLFTRAFTPVADSHDLASAVPFTQLVPAVAGTQSVRLRVGSSVLASLDRSLNAPNVTLVTPSPGAHWNGTKQVSWQASDPDGDPLSYTVQYSADAGNTWLTLASGIKDTKLAVDAGTIQGSRDCRVRVLASDGLNTTAVTSEQFGVDPHQPTAAIVTVRLSAGGQATLTGIGYDADDGPLTGRSISWRSSRDGLLGTGATLVTTHRLSRGHHVITLTAEDSNGNRATARVTIDVHGHNLPKPPSALRAHRVRNGVLLRWRDNARRERFYVLQRATRPRRELFTLLTRLPRNTHSFLDRSRSAKKSRYRVQACNAAGCSEFATSSVWRR